MMTKKPMSTFDTPTLPILVLLVEPSIFQFDHFDP